MSTASPHPGFGLSVGFVGPVTVLGVQGVVDRTSAAELGAVLGAVIGRGHQTVVLDLSELESMDDHGVQAISDGATRLRTTGRSLRVRAVPGHSLPEALQHLFDVDGGLDPADLEGLGPGLGAALLGPEQSGYGHGDPGPRPRAAVTLPPTSAAMSGASAAMSGASTSGPSAPTGTYGLTNLLRKVTAIPSDDGVVDSALRLVVALARVTIGGADGVSVSLSRHGRLATVAASDQTISDMDASQYSTGEGPCVDASVQGRWFHVASLDTESRWPDFTPRARALGINAILSSPLLARERPVGALNIYSRTVAAFAPKDQELASVFAAEASNVLAYAGLDITDEHLAHRLGQALLTRQLIAQAQGVMMERDGVDQDRAYTRLRRISIGLGRPLREQAEAVLETTRRSP